MKYTFQIYPESVRAKLGNESHTYAVFTALWKANTAHRIKNGIQYPREHNRITRVIAETHSPAYIEPARLKPSRIAQQRFYVKYALSASFWRIYHIRLAIRKACHGIEAAKRINAYLEGK